MNQNSLFLTLAILFLIACQTQPSPNDEIQTTVVPPTIVATSTAETADPTSIPTMTPTPSITTFPLDDKTATDLMFDLTGTSESRAQEAVRQIMDANDPRFIAVFIELFRARQIGIVQTLTVSVIIDSLEALSGQEFGYDWPAWIEWYGLTDLVPPPGFTSWKGRIYVIIHPGFGDFLQDRFPSRIRVEEIQWGGVGVDGIPPLNNPRMIPADQATYLNPGDPVFGLHINGEAKAYPLRIMDWHEMANDFVGDVPVSLAYCTLCGAAVAYDGRASDGNTYQFGTSGFLFRSNKLMYDRQTKTLWNQLTGEPVLGELADTDVTLPILPVVLTTWEEWQAKHPDTLVLDEDTGFPRDYTPGAAYGDYFAYEDTMFPVPQRDDLLDTKAQIFALRINGLPKAYPLDVITQEQVVNDVLADTAVVVIAPRDTITVEGNNLRAGAVTYTAGGEVRAYERGAHTFSPSDDPDLILDADGNEWQVTEDALIGPTGETLPRLGGHLAYWFGWFAFFPNTLVYGQ